MTVTGLKFRTQIVLIIGLMLCGMMFIFAAGLITLHDRTLEERQNAVRNLTESAHSLVSYYVDEAKAGRMSEDSAKQAALAALRAVRYGDNEYFFGIGLDGIQVLQPVDAKVVGKFRLDVPDAKGKLYFKEFVEVGKSGGGFVEYYRNKPGDTTPLPKISYVKLVAPWGWVIGTGLYTDDVRSAFLSTAALEGLAVLLIVIVVFGAAYFITRDSSATLIKVSAAIRSLAEGDLSIQVEEIAAQNEVGDISRALRVFRDNAVSRQELEESQQREQEAKNRRQSAVEQLTRDFSRSVQGVLRQVSGSAQELRSAAQVMTQVAEDTSHRSNLVQSAAQHAAHNVETVAAAAEELAASQSEIAQQVTRSSQVSAAAADEATRVSGVVDNLSHAMAKIDSIVTFIAGIAGKTNLLALNATIEAARAGEAGKGFAVVADEVKTLANQTSKATGDITAQVHTVQEMVQQTVGAISAILDTVGTVGETATAIASAVEEQTAATQEIARNVNEAASGTREVTSNIGDVSQAATTTGGSAVQVLNTAQGLTQQAEQLAVDVGDFLDAMKKAGERRSYERLKTRLTVKVTVAGRVVEATLLDISQGGAHIDKALAVPSGEAISLTLPDGLSVRGRVINQIEDRTHLQFALDNATQDRLARSLDVLPKAA